MESSCVLWARPRGDIGIATLKHLLKPCPPHSYLLVKQIVDFQEIPGPGRRGVSLIITRRWFFHRLGRRSPDPNGGEMQGSRVLRDARPWGGHLAASCSGKKVCPWAEEHLPTGADERNIPPAWAKTRVIKNWGGELLKLLDNFSKRTSLLSSLDKKGLMRPAACIL